MRCCFNCYNSFICETKYPEYYKRHLEGDFVCWDWEDDAIDYNDRDYKESEGE